MLDSRKENCDNNIIKNDECDAVDEFRQVSQVSLDNLLTHGCGIGIAIRKMHRVRLYSR